MDLLIRIGGEQRLSDFLLWESAYAELYFTDVLWPEFTGADLATAVQAFSARDRRYGGTGDPHHDREGEHVGGRQPCGAFSFASTTPLRPTPMRLV